ncbi:FAD dependent oxidoreductase-domain-containing protein [Cryomyces antarcticus]
MSSKNGRATLPTPSPSFSFWHTEPSPLLLGHRSTRDLPPYADVVIVGSGITGAAAAYHLTHDARAKGMSVLMLEAREACWGATGRNGGHCQPLLLSHPCTLSIPLFELSNYRAIQSLIAAHAIDCEFVVQPSVRAFYSVALFAAAEANIAILIETAPHLAALLTVVRDRPTLERLRVPNAVGAVVSQPAARLWPYKLVARVLGDLLTAPAATDSTPSFNLQTQTPVTWLAAIPLSSSAPAASLQTPRGSLRARSVILATNAYTSHLLPAFADLIVPVRGQMSALLPPKRPISSPLRGLRHSYGFLGAQPGQHDYLVERDENEDEETEDYLIQPPGGGELLFGGGRSEGPSIGLCDDGVVDERVARYLRRALPRLMGAEAGGPGTGTERTQEGTEELEATHEWTGIMGYSRDGLPWVGARSAMADGLYISAGYTGHGMPNAWLCGKAVVRMLLAADASVGNTRAKDRVGDGAGEEMDDALPPAYAVTEERARRARMRPGVGMLGTGVEAARSV